MATASYTTSMDVTPGAIFQSIEAPPVAEIVQIQDLTLSDSWLTDAEKGHDRRARILAILTREVSRADGGGVLLVCTKKVLRALHEDVFGTVPDDDHGLRKPLLGAVPRWYGPSTHGVNDFEPFSTVLLVGRLQPRIQDIEATARAVYASDCAPVSLHDAGPLPAQERMYLMQDGSEVAAKLHTHRDPRVHAILAQSRECGILQALARLRLVVPDKQKRVVVLSNLPLPGLPVTRLVDLQVLARGLESELDPRGFLRLEQALQATPSRPVRGTRLSAIGLANDLPRDFQSLHAAKEFRRRRTTEDISELCTRIAKHYGWPLTHILLRKPIGGRPTPAVVFVDAHAACEQASLLWPGLTPSIQG